MNRPWVYVNTFEMAPLLFKTTAQIVVIGSRRGLGVLLL